jgi:hypothetical protein
MLLAGVGSTFLAAILFSFPLTVAAGSAGISTASGSPAPAEGKLELSTRRLDFGDEGHGRTVRRTLTLRNSGDAPLKIGAMKPSCGCTQIEKAPIGKTLAPGDSIEVAITMSSGRAVGALDKHITIETDGSPPRVDVATTMRIFSDYRVGDDPETFEGEVDGQPCERTFEISSRDGKESFAFEVERVVTSDRAEKAENPHFRTAIEPIPGGQRLRITLLPTHPEGRFSGNVEAKLDGKPFHVAIAGEVFRGIKLSPRYINLNAVDPKKETTWVQSAHLIAIDGVPFQILSTRVDIQRGAKGAEWKVRTEELDGAKQHRVELRVTPPKEGATGSFFGELHVETDHPEKPRVSFRILGFFPTSRR